jgi:hypothetical protein
MRSYPDSPKLPALYMQVADRLSIDGDTIKGDAEASGGVRKIMRTLSSVVDGIAENRNNTSRHGSTELSAAEPKHAHLVFNSVVALAEFVADNWTPESPED